jgi:hypothetical protein
MLLAFVDAPQRLGRLTIFPVVSSDEPHLSYLLMADALRRGVLTIEGDPAGDPLHLVAQNKGPQPVLILDCENMAGEKTSRATNQSVLLGPSSVTLVPVSCQEVGRWSCKELEERFSGMIESFPLLEAQVGILAFLDRQLLGLDVLGSPDLYAPVHGRLLTGHLVTVLAAGKRPTLDQPAREPELKALAKALQDAQRVAAPCPGRGRYSTLHGEVTGGELTHNGHLVHLSVFPNGTVA